MPTFQFEAMDATGQEIKDSIDAATEEDAQTTIRQMGYYVTRISVKRSGADEARSSSQKRKSSFVIGGASTKVLTAFTRQLSILQDAGLPILRSLKILEGQSRPGALKNALIDVCDDIESGATLSEAMGKQPRVFDRLYVNMIKAGEAGGALELILQRLAEFMERAESLKRKVKGALIYPIVVIIVAVGILTGIMLYIVPVFQEMFDEFELTLPAITLLLMAVSANVVKFWFLIPTIPILVFIIVKLLRKFRYGRMGWDLFILKFPVLGKLVEKNCLARTTRTLGTLVASGVPILEGLTITRDTSGNAMFERLFGKVSAAIREGEPIAQPLQLNSRPSFHPMAMFFYAFFGSVPGVITMCLHAESPDAQLLLTGGLMTLAGVSLPCLYYLLRMNARVVDDLVVNMVAVGEETGELDTMLYKIADQYDEEVKTLTDGLMALLEPVMIVFLGGAVGFIVVALFMPLVDLITQLSG